jgi:hypothetical protein
VSSRQHNGVSLDRVTIRAVNAPATLAALLDGIGLDTANLDTDLRPCLRDRIEKGCAQILSVGAPRDE